MVKEKTRFYYGVVFLLILMIASLCKGIYTKYNNDNKNIEPVFLALSITNGEPHKDMAKRAQGKSVVHLHNSDLAQIKLSYPSKDEQKKIDSYFLKFDSLIALHQRKLDHLQLLKKGLLQQMFV